MVDYLRYRPGRSVLAVELHSVRPYEAWYNLDVLDSIRIYRHVICYTCVLVKPIVSAMNCSTAVRSFYSVWSSLDIYIQQGMTITANLSFCYNTRNLCVLCTIICRYVVLV